MRGQRARGAAAVEHGRRAARARPRGRLGEHRRRRRVVGRRPAGQVGDERGQLRPLAAQHPPVEHPVEAADDRLQRDVRHRTLARRQLERVADELLEAGDRALAALDRLRPRGGNLQQAQPQRSRVLAGRGEQRADRRFHAPGPAVGLAEGDLQPSYRPPDDQLVRRQQAVLLVVEQLVEGLARDARPRDHVGHARRAVAVLADRVDHRQRQAQALAGAHLLARHRARGAGAGAQTAAVPPAAWSAAVARRPPRRPPALVVWLLSASACERSVERAYPHLVAASGEAQRDPTQTKSIDCFINSCLL